MASLKQVCPEEPPSSSNYVTHEVVIGYEDVMNNGHGNENVASSATSTLDSNKKVTTELAINDTNNEGANSQSNSLYENEQAGSDLENPSQQNRSQSIAIGTPSPSGLKSGSSMRVTFDNVTSNYMKSDFSSNVGTIKFEPAKKNFHSQSLYVGDLERDKYVNGDCPQGKVRRNPRDGVLRDKRFNSFKTWSGKLERLTTLRGRHEETITEDDESENNHIETLPVDRYFDALEGPELDTLKASEVSVLPEDKKWPFLLRFPISAFGICLGVSSQAILWKSLATSPSTKFLHVPSLVNMVLWCASLALIAIVSSIYLFKIILYFEAVKREYYHPVRVNFFFAPWIACLFLALGAPPSLFANLRAPIWYVLMSPILCLELKIYGQWMSGGQRRLSKVANPSNHLSVVGNFVGALLGASMGLKEGPIFFFAVGLAHYTVLFVTLYQRLPTNETLPKELHPVFFLFVAAPSVASMAWAGICEDFNYGSRIAYFIALFLYVSLAVRINFFRGFRFSLAWWAYTFPMTGAAVSTIRYATEVKNPLTQSLSILLSTIAIVTVAALLVTTMLHAFIMRDLFPNDILIAISNRAKGIDDQDSEVPISIENLRTQFSV